MSRPIRILMISHTCQSASEGLPKCEELSRYLDMRLTVLVPDRWKHYGKWRSPDIPESPSYEHAVGKIRFPWTGLTQSYFHYYQGLKGLIEEFRPDVIDLWEEPWSAVSYQTCRLRNRYFPSIRIVSETEQNIDKRLPPPFEYFRQYTLRHADFIVGRNKESLEIVRRKGYRGKSQVVPNAVDTSIFKPMDRAKCRKKLGIEEAFWIGYFGRMVKEKGVLDLVDAVAACPDVRLLLVGDGPAEELVRQRIAFHRLGGRVKIEPAKSLRELPVWMNALDVFVLPSHTTRRWKEQFGRVIIEAHACGIPVIGSSSGAIPEVVGDGGMIFPDGDVAALASALHFLAANPLYREQYGNTGQQIAATRYTWRHVADQMACIYRKCLHLDDSPASAGVPRSEAPVSVV